MIWRADGLAEVLAALGRGFGSLAILPVHGDAATPAIRVLVRAVKGGKAPARILRRLMLNDESGVPNKEVAGNVVGEAGTAAGEPVNGRRRLSRAIAEATSSAVPARK